MHDETSVQEPEAVETEEPAGAPEDVQGAEDAQDAQDDPWAWTQGLEPAHVRKTWEQYTQTREELLAEKKRLEPLREIAEAFESDPEFAQHVLSYGRRREEAMTAEEQARAAMERVKSLEFALSTKAALADLHTRVVGNGWPDFDDAELLEAAATHRIADLEAAYLKLNKDAIFNAIKKGVEAAEVDKKKAKVETRAKADVAKSTYTQEDIAKMSDEEFERNYDAILASFRKG